MNVDISFPVDGKKIGYYTKDRSSNEGGGNIILQNKPKLCKNFSTCDISNDKENYISSNSRFMERY